MEFLHSLLISSSFMTLNNIRELSSTPNGLFLQIHAKMLLSLLKGVGDLIACLTCCLSDVRFLSL